VVPVPVSVWESSKPSETGGFWAKTGGFNRPKPAVLTGFIKKKKKKKKNNESDAATWQRLLKKSYR
jgi:hypothetical protein